MKVQFGVLALKFEVFHLHLYSCILVTRLYPNTATRVEFVGLETAKILKFLLYKPTIICKTTYYPYFALYISIGKPSVVVHPRTNDFLTLHPFRDTMPDIKKITVHNKISENFRQTHVDGAYGGLTPRGLLNLNFFAERSPIPKSQDLEVIDNARVGNVISNSPDSKIGIIREFHHGIYMDLNVAKEIVKLLSTQIALLEKAIQEGQKNK